MANFLGRSSSLLHFLGFLKISNKFIGFSKTCLGISKKILGISKKSLGISKKIIGNSNTNRGIYKKSLGFFLGFPLLLLGFLRISYDFLGPA